MTTIATGDRFAARSSFAARLLVAAALSLCAGGARADAPGKKGRGASPSTLVFMSDFGVVDDSVALCKGVMLGVAPELRVIDLTHQVATFSILDGARFLAGAAPYFPSDAVFVGVVDPGVGSARKPLVLKTKRGQLFVLPDNGLITLVEQLDGIAAAREITNPEFMIGAHLSSTFHGRDVFSPTGAHLARGDDFEKVGPPVKDWVRLDVKPAALDATGIRGEVIATDGPYGNLVTNVDEALFRKLGYGQLDPVTVRIGERSLLLPFAHTFSDVPLGQPLLYIDSRGHVALAINQGDFSTVHKIKPPPAVPLFIPVKSAQSAIHK